MDRLLTVAVVVECRTSGDTPALAHAAALIGGWAERMKRGDGDVPSAEEFSATAPDGTRITMHTAHVAELEEAA